MKGIYKICINDQCYVGMDSHIGTKRRFRQHLSELSRGVHWNKQLQADFDEYGEDNLRYTVLEILSDDTERHNMEEREIHYIAKLDTFNNGYNMTHGGVGMRGYKCSEEQLEERSKRLSGENNVHSKISDADFLKLVGMLADGYTNREVADKFGLHDRYVSLIRHKKRHTRQWKLVEGYEPSKSNGQVRGLDYEQFKDVVEHIENGWTNADVQRKFGLSDGTGSRIRHRKLYKRFWSQLDAERESSTTSHTA